MRLAIRWALGITVALTVAALLQPHSSTKVVQAIDQQERPATTADAVTANSLPRTLEPYEIARGQRDIFAPLRIAEPPRLTTPPPPPSPPAVAPAQVTATPTAPPVSVRYLGAMVTPGGQRLVMLARGDVVIPVEPGSRLDDGYVVQSISDDAVRLTHPAAGAIVDLPIPPVPAVSTALIQ